MHFLLLSYGCQMNRADSDRIRTALIKEGFDETENPSIADVFIVLTCAVRQHAEDRVHGRLWSLARIKREKPWARFVLAGCLAQEHGGELFNTYPFLDLIVGTHQFDMITNLLKEGEKGLFTDDSQDIKPLENPCLIRKDLFKADIPIMRGCNNFCSYCIVPYVRGREVSIPVDDVLREIESLPKTVKEILILGQNVNSYKHKGLDFSDLLKMIAEAFAQGWIRFLTPHPRDFTRDVTEVIASYDNICNQVHLPLQSGSDRILSLMNRGYTLNDYAEKVDIMKGLIPNLSLSTDLITGFPSETEEDFEDTLDCIQRFGFSSAFTYKYSPRKGTKAFDMDGQIEPEVRRERLIRLINAVHNEVTKQTLYQVGRRVKVLIEGRSKHSGTFMGREEGNRVVHIKDAENYIGSIVDVRLTGADGWNLYGEIV